MSAETVTVEQQEALIEFLERHKELALGRFSRTKEGRSLSKRLWVECANTLNSVSANCPTRGPEAWRTYYADYKSKLLKRIKRNKQELSATGGGQFSQRSLTALQERLYTILGRDVGEPLTGVRHNPLDVTFETDGGDGGEDVNIIDWPMEMDTSAVTVETTTAALATTTSVIATTTAANETITEPIETTTSAMTTTTAAMATTITATSSTATTEPRRTEPASRRRRRYRHREHEPEMTPLESAEQRLAAIESRSADATFALAQAIERLADALDGHRRRPIQVVLISDNEEQTRRRRRSRIYSSSESD